MINIDPFKSMAHFSPPPVHAVDGTVSYGNMISYQSYSAISVPRPYSNGVVVSDHCEINSPSALAMEA